MDSIPRNRSREQEQGFTIKQAAIGVGITALVGITAFAAMRYRVAGPSQYIARTGLAIKDIAVSKSAVQWPFQTCSVIDMSPKTLDIKVQTTSKEQFPYLMPTAWTVAPKNDPAGLVKYARNFIDATDAGFTKTLEGVIEGNVRASSAEISLDDLFEKKQSFKEEVVQNIRTILEEKFGVEVIDGNIRDLADIGNNRHLKERQDRYLTLISQQARVGVAKSERDGDIGSKEHEKDKRMQMALLESHARISENDTKLQIEQSNNDLAVKQAELRKLKAIADATATADAETKTLELQQNVESKRKETEEARLRAKDLAVTTIAAESKVREAEGEATAVRLRADAQLYSKQKEADGIRATVEAQAKGLEALVSAAGGTDHLIRYLMVRDGQLIEMTKQQAEGFRGLNPKVNIWTTGDSKGSPLSGVVTDLAKGLLPTADAVFQQTGLDFLGLGKVEKQAEENLPKEIPVKS